MTNAKSLNRASMLFKSINISFDKRINIKHTDVCFIDAMSLIIPIVRTVPAYIISIVVIISGIVASGIIFLNMHIICETSENKPITTAIYSNKTSLFFAKYIVKAIIVR